MTGRVSTRLLTPKVTFIFSQNAYGSYQLSHTPIRRSVNSSIFAHDLNLILLIFLNISIFNISSSSVVSMVFSSILTSSSLVSVEPLSVLTSLGLASFVHFSPFPWQLSSPLLFYSSFILKPTFQAYVFFLNISSN